MENILRSSPLSISLMTTDMGGSALFYVLDTSAILSDPKCLERLATKQIVIPLATLTELEEKRNHPELGYPARTALRYIEEYRKVSNCLTESTPTREGGSIRVEINSVNESSLPAPLRTVENDNRILAVAHNLSKDADVTLLTKDLPLRLKASVAGVKADDYSSDGFGFDVNWNGVKVLDTNEYVLDELYRDGKVSLSTTMDDVVNTSYILRSYDGQSALGRLKGDGFVHLVKPRKIFDLGGRSAEQRLAIDLLCDDEVGIVSLAGKGGTGKTSIAVAAGLEAVLEKNSHKKITVFRPLYAVGGQDLGFLPGTADEKMAPWTQAILDVLEGICSQNVVDHIIESHLLEVLPLTHIRGRTLNNSFVIIEEAQNLDAMVLLTALSRLGEGSKAVLTHDIAQRDNLRVGRFDGIFSVVSKLAGSPLFGHIMLTRSERSEIAELVSNVLDG